MDIEPERPGQRSTRLTSVRQTRWRGRMDRCRPAGPLSGLETAGGPAAPMAGSLQVSSSERTTAVSWRNAARSPPRSVA